MSRKLEGSGRPGNNYGANGARIEVSKLNTRTPKPDPGRYLEEDYSEKRREDVKRQIGAKILLDTLNTEITEHIRLTKKLKI